MADPNDKPLKITLDDIASVAVPEPAVIAPVQTVSGPKVYGTINEAAEQFVPVSNEKGSILLQGWFYLGIAGLIGALAGWAIVEPGFVDGKGGHWGNFLMLPSIITLMCFGFAMSESAVERSAQKAVLRGVLSLPLGLILGFFFDLMANVIYNLGLGLCYQAGAQSYHNPAVWIARGIAWMVFGAAGGLVYGIIGQSAKKGYYGVLGGVLGAGLGGTLFDPIAMLTNGGAPSRAVGFALVGIATGVGMGLVESALKDRWFYVVAGPLAGKQFILYKSLTTIGSRQQSDIYLFKDPAILPEHAVIQITGARVQLRANGPVHWAGQTISNRVLQDGDLLQVGRYSFRYKEKQRS
ncbi:MAG TPA: FHA domain-containing protein [Terriglobales bacterium]|nr:FHA domain-containing protein [Terriglobales bacterium]